MVLSTSAPLASRRRPIVRRAAFHSSHQETPGWRERRCAWAAVLQPTPDMRFGYVAVLIVLYASGCVPPPVAQRGETPSVGVPGSEATPQAATRAAELDARARGWGCATVHAELYGHYSIVTLEFGGGVGATYLIARRDASIRAVRFEPSRVVGPVECGRAVPSLETW